jgi:hypothetical protein
VLVVAGAALTGCGSSLLGTTSTTPAPSASTTPASTSATTAPLNGEVAVAFPVVGCTTASAATGGSGTGGSGTGGGTGGGGTGGGGTGGGGTTSTQGWNPTILLAPIPTALVGKVEFYSDGAHTVLGPTGWTCSVITSNQGAIVLVVYPADDPNPPITGIPAAGSEGVFATFDSTGHAQGAALVCPFFTIPSWQQKEADCSGSKPAGELASMSTPDVVSVTDPAGVVGSLEGSGGVFPVTGTVIFPQVIPAVTDGSSVDIAEESCSLTATALCPTVLSDFEVREFPVPASAGR